MAYNNRGEVCETKYDPSHAIADFHQALKLDPSLATARQGLELVQGLPAAAGPRRENQHAGQPRRCRLANDPVACPKPSPSGGGGSPIISIAGHRISLAYSNCTQSGSEHVHWINIYGFSNTHTATSSSVLPSPPNTRR
jgi:hypothetical protein